MAEALNNGNEKLIGVDDAEDDVIIQSSQDDEPMLCVMPLDEQQKNEENPIEPIATRSSTKIKTSTNNLEPQKRQKKAAAGFDESYEIYDEHKEQNDYGLAHGLFELGDQPLSIVGLIKEGKYLYAVTNWQKRTQLPDCFQLEQDSQD